MDKLLRVADAFPEVFSYLAKNALIAQEKNQKLLETLAGTGHGTADESINYKKYVAEYLDDKFGHL
jgi:hypothetical protein